MVRKHRYASTKHACTMLLFMPMHMRADDDLLALTKLEIDKKKAAPADKGPSASAGCGQCHSFVAVLYAVLLPFSCWKGYHAHSLRGSEHVQSWPGQEEQADR